MLGPVIMVEPYNFTAIQFGLTRFGTIIGTLIALLLSGPLSDSIANWMSRRNGGIREAEHRLPLFMLGIVCMPGCLLIFGLCAYYVCPVLLHYTFAVANPPSSKHTGSASSSARP